jgi:hypothetical protein
MLISRITRTCRELVFPDDQGHTIYVGQGKDESAV